ncbi:MAG TPA: hypothetical protein VGC79_33330, partial [Polyangiaceae bacterium]
MGRLMVGGLALFALLSGFALPACSDGSSKVTDPNSGGGGGSNPAGGAAGLAGSADADAGSAAQGTGNPNLPAPPDDSCERFHFSEAACGEGDCPPWPCDQAVVPALLGPNYPWCKSILVSNLHCIGSFDCEAMQADGSGSNFVPCLLLYQPCSEDADCPSDSPFCVVDARHETGSCEVGVVGARCRANDDCLVGNRCIAIQADGKRSCSDGAEAAPCNVDADCDGKRCFHPPASAIVGF